MTYTEKYAITEYHYFYQEEKKIHDSFYSGHSDRFSVSDSVVCDKVSRALIRWIFRVILFFAGTKITVEGQENIPKDRAVLYIGNHRSYFDILVTYTTVPGSCGFVAKKELARIGIPAHKIPRVQEELARLTADKTLTREELGRLAEEISWLLL